ncbi:MAG: serine/threonine protein kinase [Bradymonadia bacterium]
MSAGSSVLGAGERFAERYLISAHLGDGPCSSVYCASDEHTGTRVALKIFNSEVSQAFGRAIIDGARQLTQIHHLKLCALNEAAQGDDGRVYVVSEMLEGMTLAQLVEREGPQDPQRVARLMAQVCSALSPLHQMERPHGHLSPANVFLIDLENDGDFVKVTDALPETLMREGQLEERLNLGTPRYFAPEMARQEAAGPLSDQFSIGLMAQQLLTGVQPFDDIDDAALISAMRAQAPVPVPRADNGWGQSELMQIIERCLSDDPAQRFPDVRALARALFQVKSAPAMPRPQARVNGHHGAQVNGTPQPSLTSSGGMQAVVPSQPRGPRLDDPQWLAASLGSLASNGSSAAHLTPEDSPSPFGQDALESILSDLPGDSVHDLSVHELLEPDPPANGSASAHTSPVPESPAILMTGTHDSADLAAAIAAAAGTPPPVHSVDLNALPDAAQQEDPDSTRTMNVEALTGVLDEDDLFGDMDLSESGGPPPPPPEAHRPPARDHHPATAPIDPSQVAAAIARAEAQESALDTDSILDAISEELSVTEGINGAAPLVVGDVPLVTPPPEPSAAPEAPQEEAEAPPPAPKASGGDRKRLMMLAGGGLLLVVLAVGVVLWAPWSLSTTTKRTGANRKPPKADLKTPTKPVKGPKAAGAAGAKPNKPTKSNTPVAPEAATSKAGAQKGALNGAQKNTPKGEQADPKSAAAGAQPGTPEQAKDPKATEDSFKPAIVKRTEQMLQEEELGRLLDTPFKMRLVTDPAGAIVKVNGAEIATTPYEREFVREGPMVYELQLDGHLPTTHRVDPLKVKVTAGSIVIREVILESTAPVVVPTPEPGPEKAAPRTRRNTRRGRTSRGRKPPVTPPSTGDLDNPYD